MDAGAQSCVPGCQCPAGLAQDDQGQCVPVSMCPCVHAGVVHRPGSSVQINCNTWYGKNGALHKSSIFLLISGGVCLGSNYT